MILNINELDILKNELSSSGRDQSSVDLFDTGRLNADRINTAQIKVDTRYQILYKKLIQFHF